MNTQPVKNITYKIITNPKIVAAIFGTAFVGELVIRNIYHSETIAARKAKPKKYALGVLVSAVYVGAGVVSFNKLIAKLVAMKEVDEAAKE